MQWLSWKEMDTATRIQIMEKIACISHSANAPASAKGK